MASPTYHHQNSIPVVSLAVGSLITGQVSLGTAATNIRATRIGRHAVTIYNPGPASVFIGVSSVTDTTGHQLPMGGALSLDYMGSLYGCVSSGTQTVTFAETF
jgi:hypothetical protein